MRSDDATQSYWDGGRTAYYLPENTSRRCLSGLMSFPVKILLQATPLSDALSLLCLGRRASRTDRQEGGLGGWQGSLMTDGRTTCSVSRETETKQKLHRTTKILHCVLKGNEAVYEQRF